MKLLICFFLLIISDLAFSQEKDDISGQVDKTKLPVPNEKNQLFYLQRDPDANTIVYVLNLDGQTLNKSNPVLSYWIRYAEQGQTQKLSFVQRRMAYGINHKEIEPGVYELHIQAYKDLKIILAPNKKSGKYQALVNIEGNEIILDHLFARISGGSIFRPNIEYFEVSGRRIDNGKKVTHRFGL